MHRYAADDAPKLAALNLKTTRERRERIESVAAKSGRSLTAEVERLLDLALDFEARLGGEEIASAMAALGQIAGQVAEAAGDGALHFRTRTQIVAAIRLAAEWVFPPVQPLSSQEFARLTMAVGDLSVVLPELVDGFDPMALAHLAVGRPLDSSTYQSYERAIQRAQSRTKSDTEARAILDQGAEALLEAQSSASKIREIASEQSRLGQTHAAATILRILAASREQVAQPHRPTSRSGETNQRKRRLSSTRRSDH